MTRNQIIQVVTDAIDQLRPHRADQTGLPRLGSALVTGRRAEVSARKANCATSSAGLPNVDYRRRALGGTEAAEQWRQSLREDD